MQNPELKEEKKEPKHVLVDTRFILEAKAKVQKIIDGFKQIEKKCKKTKQSRKAMKTMEEFVRCNITSDAISKKYFAVIHLLEKYGNANQG